MGEGVRQGWLPRALDNLAICNSGSWHLMTHAVKEAVDKMEVGEWEFSHCLWLTRHALWPKAAGGGTVCR